MIKNISQLTSGQIRAARAFLRWSAGDLAERAALGVATIQRAEAAEGAPKMTKANARIIRQAFEAAGLEFIDPNGGGEGVRMKLPSAPVGEPLTPNAAEDVR